MSQMTRLRAAREGASGADFESFDKDITPSRPKPSPPSRRRKKRGGKSRGSRLKKKQEKKERAKKLAALVADYDISAEQEQLIKMIHANKKKKRPKRQRSPRSTPKRPTSPKMTQGQINELTKMPWSSNTKPLIRVPHESPADVFVNPAQQGKKRPLRITSSMELLATLTHSEATVMRSQKAIEQHANVSRLNQGLWGTSGGLSSVREWQGRRSPTPTPSRTPSRPNTSNNSALVTPRLRPSSPVMTLQDTALRDSGVSPTLSRYLDYRSATGGISGTKGTTNPESDPRNLLVYAERSNTEQSELARRLYHELMLYELEARRPHNERRVRTRNAAQRAAEQAHQDMLDAAAELELEKLKYEDVNKPKRTFSPAERQRISKIKYKREAKLVAEAAKQERLSNASSPKRLSPSAQRRRDLEIERARYEKVRKSAVKAAEKGKQQDRRQKKIQHKRKKKKKKQTGHARSRSPTTSSSKKKKKRKPVPPTDDPVQLAMMNEIKVLRYEAALRKDHDKNEMNAKALKIQSIMRGRSERKRIKLEKIQQMREDIELQHAALKVQSIQRGRIIRKNSKLKEAQELKDLEEDVEVQKATLRIQKIQRGRIARKNSKLKEAQELKELEEDVEVQKATLKIQAITRGRKSRRRLNDNNNNMSASQRRKKKQEEEELKQAALKIQAIQRGRITRRLKLQEDVELEQAALKIQAIQRGKKARKKTKVIRKADTLKSLAEDVELEKAALRIQSIQRGRLSRKTNVLSKQTAPSKRPSGMKRRNSRKVMEEEKAMNLSLTGKGTRRKSLERPSLTLGAIGEAQEDNNLSPRHHDSALKIQAIQRGRVTRRRKQSMERRENGRNKSAETEEDKLRNELEDLKTQRAIEVHLTNELKQAAVKIQASYRGQQTRKHVQDDLALDDLFGDIFVEGDSDDEDNDVKNELNNLIAGFNVNDLDDLDVNDLDLDNLDLEDDSDLDLDAIVDSIHQEISELKQGNLVLEHHHDENWAGPNGELACGRSGWTIHASPEGKMYWHHAGDEVSVWEEPKEALEYRQETEVDGWSIHPSPDGQPYWHNSETEESVWEEPGSMLNARLHYLEKSATDLSAMGAKLLKKRLEIQRLHGDMALLRQHSVEHEEVQNAVEGDANWSGPNGELACGRSGWTIHASPEGKMYWHHAGDEKSVWEEPEEALEYRQGTEMNGWSVHPSPDGQPYWHNEETEASVWEEPAEMQEARERYMSKYKDMERKTAEEIFSQITQLEQQVKNMQLNQQSNNSASTENTTSTENTPNTASSENMSLFEQRNKPKSEFEKMARNVGVDIYNLNLELEEFESGSKLNILGYTGWEMMANESEGAYWVYTATGEISWEEPIEAIEYRHHTEVDDWEAHPSPSGHMYWHNSVSSESVWDEPFVMRERRLQYGAIKRAELYPEEDVYHPVHGNDFSFSSSSTIAAANIDTDEPSYSDFNFNVNTRNEEKTNFINDDFNFQGGRRKKEPSSSNNFAFSGFQNNLKSPWLGDTNNNDRLHEMNDDELELELVRLQGITEVEHAATKIQASFRGNKARTTGTDYHIDNEMERLQAELAELERQSNQHPDVDRLFDSDSSDDNAYKGVVGVNYGDNELNTENSSQLPSKWREAYTEDGEIYYYHEETQEVTWTLPVEKNTNVRGKVGGRGVRDSLFISQPWADGSRKGQSSRPERHTDKFSFSSSGTTQNETEDNFSFGPSLTTNQQESNFSFGGSLPADNNDDNDNIFDEETLMDLFADSDDEYENTTNNNDNNDTNNTNGIDNFSFGPSQTTNQQETDFSFGGSLPIDNNDDIFDEEDDTILMDLFADSEEDEVDDFSFENSRPTVIAASVSPSSTYHVRNNQSNKQIEQTNAPDDFSFATKPSKAGGYSPKKIINRKDSGPQDVSDTQQAFATSSLTPIQSQSRRTQMIQDVSDILDDDDDDTDDDDDDTDDDLLMDLFESFDNENEKEKEEDFSFGPTTTTANDEADVTEDFDFMEPEIQYTNYSADQQSNEVKEEEYVPKVTFEKDEEFSFKRYKKPTSEETDQNDDFAFNKKKKTTAKDDDNNSKSEDEDILQGLFDSSDDDETEKDQNNMNYSDEDEDADDGRNIAQDDSTHADDGRNIAQDDSTLLEGWHSHEAEDGAVYYYHDTTRETTWDRPTAGAPEDEDEDEDGAMNDILESLFDSDSDDDDDDDINVGNEETITDWSSESKGQKEQEMQANFNF